MNRKYVCMSIEFDQKNFDKYQVQQSAVRRYLLFTI